MQRQHNHNDFFDDYLRLNYICQCASATNMTNKFCSFTCICSLFISIFLTVMKVQLQPMKHSNSLSTKLLNGLALTPNQAVRQSLEKDSNILKSSQ